MSDTDGYKLLMSYLGTDAQVREVDPSFGATKGTTEFKPGAAGVAASNANAAAVAQAERAMAAASHIASILQTAVNEFEGLRKRLLAQADADIARLALAIAEKIIGAKAQTDPEIIRNSLRRALDNLPNIDHAELHIHPHDVPIVEQIAAQMEAEGTTLRVVPDPGIQPGGAYVLADIGEIDATIRGQLDSIAESLGVSPVVTAEPSEAAIEIAAE